MIDDLLRICILYSFKLTRTSKDVYVSEAVGPRGIKDLPDWWKATLDKWNGRKYVEGKQYADPCGS